MTFTESLADTAEKDPPKNRAVVFQSGCDGMMYRNI